MIKKTLSVIAILLASTILQASPLKLDSYDAIKHELIEGKKIKAIVDFGKCRVIEGPIVSGNVIGFTFDNFVIYQGNNAIVTNHSFLNPLDKRNPYGAPGYAIGEILIMPNNDVMVDTAVLTLPDYKTLEPSRLLCRVGDSAKFYRVH